MTLRERLTATLAEWRADAEKMQAKHRRLTYEDNLAEAEAELRELRRCTDELAAILAETDWQPIETAPKENGACFLVGSARGVWAVVVQTETTRRWLPIGDETRKLGPPETESWYENAVPHTGDELHSATHWQPLPAPPQEPQP